MNLLSEVEIFNWEEGEMRPDTPEDSISEGPSPPLRVGVVFLGAQVR